jgi:cell division protein FtsI (penicillin-binding protein 3)
MRMGRTDSRTRMVLVLLAFAVLAVAASVRLGQWQIVEAGVLSSRHRAIVAAAKAAAQPQLRADIVDRHGKVLAKTSFYDQLVAYPNTMDADDDEQVVELLGTLLDLKPREERRYRSILEQAHAADTKFVVLAPKLSLDQSELILDAIEDELLDGIGLEPRPIRSYPKPGGEPDTTLASHVLGFVRADGKGGSGVESYYDEQLTSADPETIELASLDGTAITLSGLDPEPLELTIDAKLQKQVEKELYSAWRYNQAKSASAIVMDPQTGAILAAATVPAFDAEDYAAVAARDMSRLRNRVFQDQYEPGSVMKIFTATAALDLGVVHPNTIVRDQAKLEFYQYTVRNADHRSLGALKVKDVIARSRNVATAKIARKLAPNSTKRAAQRLYGLWDKVGLTGRTGAGVTGEAAGSWCDPDECPWVPHELANRAFGQGISVTLPQLARGLSALVNGGYRVQPYLVADSEQSRVEPERVISAKTARQAKDILRHVTGSVPWYAQGALIPGYDIGGKTGTAQIWDTSKNQWKERRFNHSFIGFVGSRKQEYVIAVRLEEPKPIRVEQGVIPLSIESYELFEMVASATIRSLGMKKLKDPDAGRPIIGTEAARVLTPERNRAGVRSPRQETKQAVKSGKTKRQQGQPKLASEQGPAKPDRGDP